MSLALWMLNLSSRQRRDNEVFGWYSSLNFKFQSIPWSNQHHSQLCQGPILALHGCLKNWMAVKLHGLQRNTDDPEPSQKLFSKSLVKLVLLDFFTALSNLLFLVLILLFIPSIPVLFVLLICISSVPHVLIQLRLEDQRSLPDKQAWAGKGHTTGHYTWCRPERMQPTLQAGLHQTCMGWSWRKSSRTW